MAQKRVDRFDEDYATAYSKVLQSDEGRRLYALHKFASQGETPLEARVRLSASDDVIDLPPSPVEKSESRMEQLAEAFAKEHKISKAAAHDRLFTGSDEYRRLYSERVRPAA